MKVRDIYGRKIDFEAAVSYMDDEIRENLHFKICPCTEQEFYNAYARAHEEKFGELFTMEKLRFLSVFGNMMIRKFIDGDSHFNDNECPVSYVKDMYESALELNSLTLDTIDFLFGEMGGVEINDGFIMEV